MRARYPDREGIVEHVRENEGVFRAKLETLLDLPASERFFAGGDTTVRGFVLDRLGTPETLDPNGFPIGGNGLVIFNAELRLTVHRGFGVVTFVDTGNVFARTSDIDLGRLRSSVGFGLRYRSPIGPIRVDLGFKVHREQTSPGVVEPLSAVFLGETEQRVDAAHPGPGQGCIE